MMDPLIANYFERFKTLHKDCTEQFSALKKEALDWSPGEEMNSIAILVAHIAGSEKFWIGDIVMQEPSGRDRPMEFATKSVDAEQLQILLDDTLDLVENALNRLGPDDLHDTRILSGDRGEVTVGWVILHTLQHTALHVGHMQLTKQLLESAADN